MNGLFALTFEAICCRFGLPARLTHDNDVRFQTLWKELWRILGTKITCTSAYNPQADPAERANRQVLEALRAAVASVTDFDQWDQALPHLCFGLNTHPSSVTQTSPFELAHGFPARVPLMPPSATMRHPAPLLWVQMVPCAMKFTASGVIARPQGCRRRSIWFSGGAMTQRK